MWVCGCRCTVYTCVDCIARKESQISKEKVKKEFLRGHEKKSLSLSSQVTKKQHVHVLVISKVESHLYRYGYLTCNMRIVVENDEEKFSLYFFIPTCITLFVQNYVPFVYTHQHRPTNEHSNTQQNMRKLWQWQDKRKKLIFDLCLSLWTQVSVSSRICPLRKSFTQKTTY